MKIKSCNNCQKELSINDLYDIVTDKDNPEIHLFDTFKCSFCKNETTIEVKKQPSTFIKNKE